MTQAPEQSSGAPVRARSGRRPLPPLIFLLVLLGVLVTLAMRKRRDRQVYAGENEKLGSDGADGDSYMGGVFFFPYFPSSTSTGV